MRHRHHRAPVALAASVVAVLLASCAPGAGADDADRASADPTSETTPPEAEPAAAPDCFNPHGGACLGPLEPGADFRILCAHNPSIWRAARESGYDLVLAGHLHGCQGVLFEAGGRLYPGALFYPHNHIRQAWNGSRLLVSMGCSDLIPIRWGCPREIVVCIL